MFAHFEKIARNYDANPRGHVWVREPNGDINMWQYSQGNHNGPRCVNCDETFCEHCRPDGPNTDCPNAPIEGKVTRKGLPAPTLPQARDLTNDELAMLAEDALRASGRQAGELFSGLRQINRAYDEQLENDRGFDYGEFSSPAIEGDRERDILALCEAFGMTPRMAYALLASRTTEKYAYFSGILQY